jgi:hypothetical protein
VILEDAARSGLFNTTATRQILSLVRQFRVYNLRISQLMSLATMGASSENTWGGGISGTHQRELNNLVKHMTIQCSLSFGNRGTWSTCFRLGIMSFLKPLLT